MSAITPLRERAQSCALRAISLTPTGSVDDVHSVARYPVMRHVRVIDPLSSVDVSANSSHYDTRARCLRLGITCYKFDTQLYDYSRRTIGIITHV